MKVVFFQRKPRRYGTFSLEAIIKDLRSRLPEWISSEVRVSRYESNGFFRRLFCALEAAGHQGDVNHVTGDVHFLSTFLKREKTILTILDCGVMQSPSALKRWIYQLFFLKIPVWRSRYVTAISEATRQEIIHYTNCPPEKVVVIPVAISENYKPYPKAFAKERPVLLHVGLAPNKNLNRLIEAIEGLKIHLAIVGKLEQAHIEKLKERGISYEYVFNISDEEMLEQYRRCDLLAFASTLEGFGMPIVEANSIGRPVLTSNTSSMPEVAGDAACLVNPYDTNSIRKGVLKIIEDEPYRNQLIANGFKNCQRFKPDEIAEKYLKLYIEASGRKELSQTNSSKLHQPLSRESSCVE